MCGISGVAGEIPGGEAIVERMNADQARRGPDAEGIESWDHGRVVFGHRRLSIFDLSELGRQPMLSPDRNIGLVFNGAVYNFLELRRDLEQLGYRFKSQSDTEVIVHGYAAWGIDKLVSRMRGMFAIAIWDHKARKLFLVRDRLGVKPLVYAVRGSQVAFASTVRALDAAGFGGDIDPQGVAEFFEFGFVSDRRTIFENPRKVRPATIVEFADGAAKERVYWTETVARPAGSVEFEEAVEETERIFLEAVKLRLEADVPVGALLSGGVDSSLVCWAIAKLGGNIKAFTVGTPGDPNDETADAVATARKLDIQHEIVEMRSEDEPDIGDLTDAYGEPFGCSSALGMLRVSKAIKPSATVLLTGDGGDDCFLGYPEYKNFYMAQKLAKATGPLNWLWKPKGGRRDELPPKLRRAAHFLDFAYGGLGARVRIHDGLPRFHENGLLGERLRGASVEQRRVPVSAESAKRLLPDFIVYHREHQFAGEYMTKVDGGAMYYALEARAPFLDQELWNFAHSLPYEIRLRKGVLKAVLREIARRRIGEQVASGKKRGFSIPVERWLAGRWRGRYEELLRDSTAAAEGWIDAKAVKRLLDGSKTAAPKALWYIFVFETWMRSRKSRERELVGRP